jgi:hypothetical protein
MPKSILCSALLLALFASAVSRSLRTEVAGNAPNPATLANAVANATDGEQPVVPPSVCSSSKSPSDAVTSGSRFKAELSGLKNIKPNTTGKPQPGGMPPHQLVVPVTGINMTP